MKALFRSGRFCEGLGYSVLRPNGAPDWLLIVSIGGAGEHRWSLDRADERQNGSPVHLRRQPAGRVPVPAGTALLYPPGTPQWYGTEERTGRWELVWTHFPNVRRLDSLLDWPVLDWPEATERQPRLLELGPALAPVREAMQELSDWHTAARSNRLSFAWNALERALLWCQTVNPLSVDGALDDRVSKAARIISADLGSRHTIGALCERVGISRSRLAHLFRSETGESFPEYLERRRMERAEDQLRMTSLPVSEIARSVGFDDPLYFSRRFKRFTGMSPRRWREATNRGVV